MYGAAVTVPRLTVDDAQPVAVKAIEETVPLPLPYPTSAVTGTVLLLSSAAPDCGVTTAIIGT